MSTVLFSNTFLEKINTIIKRFWWAGIKEEYKPALLPTALGMTFVNPKKRVAWV